MDKQKEPTQEQLDIFVQHNVDRCQSSLVEALLAYSGHSADGGIDQFPTHEDIVNYYIYKCPECGAGQSEPFDSEPIDEKNESFDTPMHYKCYECKAEFEEEPESVPQEILEWWLCSDWLLKQLEARGQAVLHSDLGDWWGRTTSGQAISMDGVIEDIYTSLHNS